MVTYKRHDLAFYRTTFNTLRAEDAQVQRSVPQQHHCAMSAHTARPRANGPLSVAGALRIPSTPSSSRLAGCHTSCRHVPSRHQLGHRISAGAERHGMLSPPRQHRSISRGQRMHQSASIGGDAQPYRFADESKSVVRGLLQSRTAACWRRELDLTPERWPVHRMLPRRALRKRHVRQGSVHTWCEFVTSNNHFNFADARDSGGVCSRVHTGGMRAERSGCAVPSKTTVWWTITLAFFVIFVIHRLFCAFGVI
ncbi:hypothetical protein BKA62DRAFT_701168 [Auriculariales sp. MPI-PUGE-AT-0066]|nr:hypothetical protein BKA62DRAFT_701168 [Auriculariales sp. MPI-PUGE-AT-0066]